MQGHELAQVIKFFMMLVLLFFGFFYTSSIFNVSSIVTCTQMCPPPSAVPLAIWLYFKTEFLVGRYFINLFAILFSCVSIYGLGKLIWSEGENFHPLVKGMASLSALQLQLSGYEYIMAWPTPLFEDGTGANLIGVMANKWAVNLFGDGFALIIWSGESVILAVMVCHFIYGIDVMARITPIINWALNTNRNLSGNLKKKYPRLEKAARFLDSLDKRDSVQPPNRSLTVALPESLEPSLKESLPEMPIDNLVTEEEIDLQNKVISSKPKIPTLTDVVGSANKVTKTALPVPIPIKQKTVANAVSLVNKQPVKPILKTTSVITLEMAKQALLEIGLDFSHLELKDGAFIWRIKATPENLQIGGEDRWRKAESALANRLGVPANNVAFRQGGNSNEYSYDITKPEELRQVVLFDDLIKSVKDGNVVSERKIILPLLLGVNIGSRVVLKCAFSINHLLIGGITGTGKSSSLHAILIYMMRFALTKKIPLNVYFSDVAGATANKYEPLQGTLVKGIARDHKQAISMLNGIETILKERVNVLREFKCQHIAVANDKLRSQGKPLHPFIIVVLEEVATLFGDKAMSATIGRLVSVLVTTGRKYGILIYASGTRITKTRLGDGASLIEETSKFSFQVNDERDAKYFGGDNFPAHKLARRGDALLLDKDTTSVLRVHTPVFSLDMEKNDALIDQWITLLAKAAGKQALAPT